MRTIAAARNVWQRRLARARSTYGSPTLKTTAVTSLTGQDLFRQLGPSFVGSRRDLQLPRPGLADHSDCAKVPPTTLWKRSAYALTAGARAWARIAVRAAAPRRSRRAGSPTASSTCWV